MKYLIFALLRSHKSVMDLKLFKVIHDDIHHGLSFVSGNSKLDFYAITTQLARGYAELRCELKLSFNFNHVICRLT